MAHIDVFKGWADTIRADTDALKLVVESKQADTDARRIAGAALLYLVSRMDLIPDWNEGIGLIDDVIVLRVCAQLLEGYKRGALPTVGEVCLDRMVNEAERVAQFLGGPLYDRLKSYCSKLGDQAVRGRTPAQLAEDADARRELYRELDDELKKSVPIVINDPVDAELRLKAYLTHKLQ